jgi:hypothetical protein
VSTGDALRERARVVVGELMPKGFLRGVEEILSVDERDRALFRGLGRHVSYP